MLTGIERYFSDQQMQERARAFDTITGAMQWLSMQYYDGRRWKTEGDRLAYELLSTITNRRAM